MAHSAAKKHVRWERATLAQRHQSTQVKAHEASVACHHNPLRLAIHINQARRSILLKRGNRLLLLRRERSDRFDLIYQRTNHGSNVVIEDRREIRVAVARQQRLERRRMGQRISRLAVANSLRKCRDIRPSDQITVLVGVVNFKVRLIRMTNGVVSLRPALLLRELQ